MLKSVISVPAQATSKRAVDVETSNESYSVRSSSHEHCKDKRLQFGRGHNGGEKGNGDGKSSQRKRSLDGVDLPTSDTSKKINDGRRRTRSGGHHSTFTPTSGLRNQTVKITSIDGKTQLKWPAEAIRHTDCAPIISYSSNPSFYNHSISLSKEEEKRRTDLFIISDLIDDMVEDILYTERMDGRSRRKKSSKKSRKKSKKSKEESAKKEADGNTSAIGETAEGYGEEKKGGEKSDECSKKHKKSKRHKKSKVKKAIDHCETTDSKTETSVCPESMAKTSPGKPSPVKTSSHAEHSLENAAKESPSDSKTSPLSSASVNKTPKKGKKVVKKKITPTSAGSTAEKDVKKPKIPKKEEEKSHSLSKPDAKAEPSQKIKIAFSGNVSKPTPSAKSKWDTSSDEEGSSRKGAISYRFSDDSDVDREKLPPVKEEVKPTKPEVPAPKPFGRMQPGGMLQTIELHNPLPDLKPSVPLAHPNPGPDGSRGRTRSRTRSRSRSRSRSSRRSRSYSSDESHYRSKRRHHRRSRRSYSRSYSRSRSGSYTSYSRSRSRSYSRSYSRSTSRSRSRSRYRSSSRTSYSSYTSYSSRSRSRSPIYTRAPKYNKTRAVNMGKRKRFKKKQFNKNQQPQQNPAIQRQLETGRAKAEETVMRLKRQKEEQQELQNRAMASIAAAASSAGISLPTTTPPTTKQSTTSSTTTTNAANSGPSTSKALATHSQQQNGGELVDSFKEASHLAQAPAFVPRNIPPREFIGPVRPGVDPESDIPLPLGTPTSGSSRDGLLQHYPQDPEPMQAPDNQDEAYKNLQEQAVKHIMANNADSPGAEQFPLQHQHIAAAAQYAPLTPETPQIVIDPLTGQHVQLAPVQTAHAVHQQQLIAANGGLASQLSIDGQEIDDSKPAPHEAVIKSYADQVIMSNHKALVSQSQPVFTIAAAAAATSSVPQTGVPIQSAPLMVNAAQAAQLQLQAQLQQAQAAQAQAVHLHNLQVQAAMQQQQQLAFASHPHLQQLLVQQQLVQQAQAAQQPQLVQLPNGQIVVAAQNPQSILLQRFPRPM